MQDLDSDEHQHNLDFNGQSLMGGGGVGGHHLELQISPVWEIVPLFLREFILWN